MITKGIGKIRTAGIAQGLGYYTNVQGSLHQQTLSPTHTLVPQKLRCTDAKLLAKNTGNLFLADAYGLRQVIQAKRGGAIGNMLLDRQQYILLAVFFRRNDRRNIRHDEQAQLTTTGQQR